LNKAVRLLGISIASFVVADGPDRATQIALGILCGWRHRRTVKGRFAPIAASREYFVVNTKLLTV
jgi:hypothetical protein